jgi:hypothetical protein
VLYLALFQTNENDKAPTELDIFIPQDGSNLKDGVLSAK